MQLRSCDASTFCVCTNGAFPVSRTPETPSAVFSGAFSQSARRSLVVDFPLHQHALTCSSCLITARRASCVTSCATLSVWTQALSSPNSAAPGQSLQEARVMQPELKKRLHIPGLQPAKSEEGHLNKRGEQWRTFKDSSFCLFLKLDEVCSKSAPSLTSKGMLFLQHNPIFNHLQFCHSQNPICRVFNLMKYTYTVAGTLILRLNRITHGSNSHFKQTGKQYRCNANHYTRGRLTRGKGVVTYKVGPHYLSNLTGRQINFLGSASIKEEGLTAELLCWLHYVSFWSRSSSPH